MPTIVKPDLVHIIEATAQETACGGSAAISPLDDPGDFLGSDCRVNGAHQHFDRPPTLANDKECAWRDLLRCVIRIRSAIARLRLGDRMRGGRIDLLRQTHFHDRKAHLPIVGTNRTRQPLCSALDGSGPLHEGDWLTPHRPDRAASGLDVPGSCRSMRMPTARAPAARRRSAPGRRKAGARKKDGSWGAAFCGGGRTGRSQSRTACPPPAAWLP